MTKRIKTILLLLAILLLGLFLRNIDFQEVFTSIRQIGWGFGWLLWVTGFGYFLAAVAWYFCFRSIHLAQPWLKLFVFRMIGETLALINPTSIVAGDAAKVYFLQKFSVPADEASASTMLSRILLIISLVFILFFSSIFFIYSTTFFENTTAATAFLVLFCCPSLVTFYLLVSEKMYLYRAAKYIFPRILPNASLDASSIYDINFATADYFKNHKTKFILAFVLSGFHWLSGAMEFYVILSLLKIPISLLNATILEMGVMLVKTAGAFVPGQIGVEEQGNRMMLSVIGLNIAGLWVVVSILRRARQLFWLGVGVLLYLFYHKKLNAQNISTPLK